jgi:hypothetical protein
MYHVGAEDFLHSRKHSAGACPFSIINSRYGPPYLLAKPGVGRHDPDDDDDDDDEASSPSAASATATPSSSTSGPT